MPPLINLTGTRFGKLVVLERVGTKNNMALWACQCDCGNKHDVAGPYLARGDTKSCGCLKLGDTLPAHGKFGDSRHHINNIPKNKETIKDETKPGGLVWIRDPCQCTHQRMSHDHFEGFCERNNCLCSAFISVSGLAPYHPPIRKWQDKKVFIEPRQVIGGKVKPSKEAYINTAGLTKTNRAVLLEFNGKTQSITAWANELGIKKRTIQMRLTRGWSVAQSLARE